MNDMAKQEPIKLSMLLEQNIRAIRVFLRQLNTMLNKTLGGNKSQAQRARVLSLHIEKLMLDFRKMSAKEMDMKKKHYPARRKCD